MNVENETLDIKINILRKQFDIPNDWVYRNINAEFFIVDALNEIIKDNNIEIISRTDINDISSQECFISLEGIDNLNKYYNENKADMA